MQLDQRALKGLAKKLCEHEGGNWNAKDFRETPNGEAPSEMRESYLDIAKVAATYLQAVRADLLDALTEERDRLKDQRDYYKARDEEGERIQAEIEAERDRLALANAELKPLLQNIGDGIANMFDQLVKGNWRDDHDHDVKMNVHMLNLQDVLKQIMRFRADYLDYSEPNFDKHKATSTEGK